MAIKRNGDKSEVSIPTKLDNLLLGGFTASELSKKYEETGKGFRGEIKTYLESNTDGFEVELSKGFKSPYGTVTLKCRQNWDVDKDALIELFKAGKLTVETLVNIASFNAEKLKTAIGDAKFEEIAKASSTEFLELRASQEFKDEISAKFADFDLEVKPAVEKAAPAPKAEPKADPKSSIEKAKAAKAKAKGKDAKSDLDEILKKK